MYKFQTFKEWLNEQQSIKINKESLPIEIIKKEDWPEGKSDPTEFSTNDNIVRVREDYDYKKDPQGWMRHEYMHWKLHNSDFEDDGKDYPLNNTEVEAYKYQFKFLKKRGFKNLEDVPGLKKDNYTNILKKYWSES